MWTRRGRAAAKAARSDTDRIAEIAVGNGEPVDDVLREVADFRLALETDMLIAAAAADAGEADIIAEVVEGERAELVSFQDRLLDRLAEAAANDSERNRRASRNLGRTRLVGAAAAVLALIGGGVVSQQQPTTAISPANATFAEADQELTILAEMTELDASTAAVEQAAEELHETIETLISEHGHDPHYALRIADLIEREQELLGRTPLPSHGEVVREVNRLAVRLVRKAPAAVRKSLPALAPVPPPPPPSKQAEPKPSPSATSKPSPKPTPKPSSSSPKPSSSSSPPSGNGLPGAP